MRKTRCGDWSSTLSVSSRHSAAIHDPPVIQFVLVFHAIPPANSYNKERAEVALSSTAEVNGNIREQINIAVFVTRLMLSAGFCFRVLRLARKITNAVPTIMSHAHTAAGRAHTRYAVAGRRKNEISILTQSQGSRARYIIQSNLLAEPRRRIGSFNSAREAGGRNKQG